MQYAKDQSWSFFFKSKETLLKSEISNYHTRSLILHDFVGCPTGYFGQNCSKPCVYPSFGERCQGECNCTDEMCNIITGCKVLDCHDGFYGSLCTKPCRYPSYGFRCQGLCDCSRESCNHIAGCRKILGMNGKCSPRDMYF